MKKYVEINPMVCNGKPVVAGTRIPLTVVLDHLGDGCSVDDIRRKYPELTRRQIVAAIRYCHNVIEHTELELAPV